MSDSIFMAAPFFMVRMPSWSLDDYVKITTINEWQEEAFRLFEESAFLREAIYIASPNLYHSLNNPSPKNKEKTARSLLKYIIRMSTRPTPFGLFSSVGEGAWSKITEVEFDTAHVKKHARVDMEWLFAKVQELFQDQKNLPGLPIVMNPLISSKHGRYYLDYLLYLSEEPASNEVISINENPLIKGIFDCSKTPLTVDNLLIRLNEFLPQIDIQKTFSVIQNLLEKQFLFSPLFPGLLDPIACKASISRLPNVKNSEDISRKIEAYNDSQAAKGGRLLEEIETLMTEGSSQSFIQVDSSLPSSKFHINKQVVLELEKTISLLWRLSSALGLGGSPKLTSYHEKFLRKYGTERRVSLSELLSSDKGLGPLKEMEASAVGFSPVAVEWEKWIAHEWEKCLSGQQSKIIITDKIIDELYRLAGDSYPDPAMAPPSMSAFCQIFADSSHEIDAGNFQVLISGLSWQSDSAFGRFLHLFGDGFVKDFKEHLHQQEELDPGAIHFECSFWPSSIRNANVTIQPCFRKYKLELFGKKCDETTLTTEDIYVGSNGNRFYLTLKEGDSELIPCFGNFLNPELSPSVVRFLREISWVRNKLIYTISLEKQIKNATFLPRITYKKTILSLAKWRLDSRQFANLCKKDVLDKFDDWATSWNLPQRFYIVESDNQLLIDRGSQACMDLLMVHLKKESLLVFAEFIESHWAKTDRGSHLSEFVVPLTKNPKFCRPRLVFSPKPHINAPFSKRVFVPGSEWIYVKLYVEKEGENRFLVNFLAQFAEFLVAECNAIGWFFIRYQDPKNHIRFRIQFPSTDLGVNSFGLFKDALENWLEHNVITDFAYAPYERELERYGGINQIDSAEHIFCRDSSSMIDFLSQIKPGLEPSSLPIIRALSVIYFLGDFGLNKDEIIELLGVLTKGKGALSGFRKSKKSLIENLENGGKFLFDTPTLFRFISEKRSEGFKKFYSDLLDGNSLSGESCSILISLLHLHCNRLGCSRQEEEQVYAYARETLIQVKQASMHTLRL